MLPQALWNNTRVVPDGYVLSHMKAEVRYSVKVRYVNTDRGDGESSLLRSFVANVVFPERPVIGDTVNFSYPDAGVYPTHYLGRSTPECDLIESDDMVIHSWAKIQDIDWVPVDGRQGHFFCLITLETEVCEYVFNLCTDSVGKIASEVDQWVTGFTGIRFADDR